MYKDGKTICLPPLQDRAIKTVVTSKNWFILSYVTYLNQCMTKPTIRHVMNIDSDQPVQPTSKARVLVHPSLDSLEAVEGTWHQQGP